MKKILFSVILLSFAFASCKSKQQIANLADITFLTDTRCNLDNPRWGESLGFVSFATDRTWTISNDSITQIWSDVVTASNCEKATFNGGNYYRMRPEKANLNAEKTNFNADCRSNPKFPGNLFSWCAVIRFQDVLCPAPWRVPTLQDFIDFDIALGGDSIDRSCVKRWWRGISFKDHSQITQLNYNLNTWGGDYVGYCKPNGAMRKRAAVYWSLEYYGCQCCAYYFDFTACDEFYLGKLTLPMNYGLTLRCVR